MKQRVINRCPEAAKKISIIHSWANPEWIVPIPKKENWFAVKHQLVEPFTVLYSGNMGRCHDVDTILEAAMELRNEPIRFVFIGNGAKRQDCISEVNRLGLRNCQFLPYQDKTDLPFSLTACDLALVTISPGMEGLVAPSKLYSALAAGRPIAAVCEDHSYLHQIINSAKCGAVFRNGDSKGLAEFIRRLANDNGITKQLGNSGRLYLESHFTPDVIAKQYGAVIRRSAFKKAALEVPTSRVNNRVNISVNRHPL